MSAKSLEIIQAHNIHQIMEKYESLYRETISRQSKAVKLPLPLKKWQWFWQRLAVPTLLAGLVIAFAAVAVSFAADYKKTGNFEDSSKHLAAKIYTEIFVDDDDDFPHLQRHYLKNWKEKLLKQTDAVNF